MSENRFPPASRVALNDHIANTWTRDKSCRRCGEVRWDADGHVRMSLTADPRIDAASSAPALPLAALYCLTCGAVELLHLGVAGIVACDSEDDTLAKAAN